VSSSPDAVPLSGEHRRTLALIFRHPTSHNLEWHDVLSLLAAIGSVRESSNGSYVVAIGTEAQTFHHVQKKDIDDQQLGDLRRMLRAAGFDPTSSQ
jgi:hypothetical protein